MIYDVIIFHANRLHINISDKCVSFWSKTKEYNIDYIHMHIDHCDYESRIYGTEYKKPLFTSLLYFNDNNSPTLLTEITREMADTKCFDDTKIALSFPKKCKNICFDSGNYYHGESYLSDEERSERKVLVIALWEQNQSPSYIPYFPMELFYYKLYNQYERHITLEDYNRYARDTSNVVDFIDMNHTIITIKIKNIKQDFFNKLIIEKEKTIMYSFKNILNKFRNVDTFILDISNNGY